MFKKHEAGHCLGLFVNLVRKHELNNPRNRTWKGRDFPNATYRRNTAALTQPPHFENSPFRATAEMDRRWSALTRSERTDILSCTDF